MTQTLKIKVILAGFAVVAVALLAPLRAQAQTYYLEYQINVQSDDNGVVYSTNLTSGAVQSTNLLTANPGATVGRASVSTACTASFGLLQSIADCSVNNNIFNGNGCGATFNGADVWFQDQLYITSATLPNGTPVNVQITCVYAGSSTPGNDPRGAFDYTTSAASVTLYNPTGNLNGVIGSVYATNQISAIISTHVGPYPNNQGYNNFVFEPFVNSTGVAQDADGEPFVGSISNNITSQTYVNVLTPGTTYVAASGTIYPALQLGQPTLYIQATNNNSVVLSWLASYTGYVLEQNPALGATNWVLNTNTVTPVNGTNYVVIDPATNNMFFQLVNP